MNDQNVRYFCQNTGVMIVALLYDFSYSCYCGTNMDVLCYGLMAGEAWPVEEALHRQSFALKVVSTL
jgi:hypothetical protein